MKYQYVNKPKEIEAHWRGDRPTAQVETKKRTRQATETYMHTNATYQQVWEEQNVTPVAIRYHIRKLQEEKLIVEVKP